MNVTGMTSHVSSKARGSSALTETTTRGQAEVLKRACLNTEYLTTGQKCSCVFSFVTRNTKGVHGAFYAVQSVISA